MLEVRNTVILPHTKRMGRENSYGVCMQTQPKNMLGNARVKGLTSFCKSFQELNFHQQLFLNFTLIVFSEGQAAAAEPAA